jgi:hypothetical protein
VISNYSRVETILPTQTSYYSILRFFEGLRFGTRKKNNSILTVYSSSFILAGSLFKLGEQLVIGSNQS